MTDYFSFLLDNLKYIFPFSIYLKLLIAVFILSVFTQIFYYSNHSTGILINSSRFIIKAFKIPLLFFLGLYVCYLGLWAAYEVNIIHIQKKVFLSLKYVIEFIVLFWCLQKALSQGKITFSNWLVKSNHSIFYIFFTMISNSLQAIIYIILLNILLSQAGLIGVSEQIIEHIMQIMLIGTIGWILIQILNGAEAFIVNKASSTPNETFKNRKITTQVKIFKSILLSITIVVITGCMLMVFDSVRTIGTGLLTTAGIIGAVGAFASQKSLAGLLSGLNIAFTQPIRIGDLVVIDGQSGQVEEITLSYVVIQLWDRRHLILPTDYFTNKGILNLTRNSTELVGTIMLYVDYTLEVNLLREKFLQLLNASPLWDKKVSAFQISDLKEQSVEIRGLVSARNANDLWDLRCEIREQLLQFLVQNLPYNLPKTRQSLVSTPSTP
jgi:small-conductance mechanosensitive channel